MALTSEEWSELERFVTPPIVRKLKKMQQRLKELEELDWTPITPDNPAPIYSEVFGPYKPAHPHLPPWRVGIVFTDDAIAQAAQGWTHFRPINAPQPKRAGGA